jgi:hypothetical protein
MTEREVLKLALEALEEIHIGNMTPMAEANWNKAITAIKEALAQPEQEPVAHTLNCVCGAVWDIKADGSEEMVHTPNTTPPQGIYYTPPQRTWVGLTDDEIALINADYPHPQGFAKAIQAKLKEKNTWQDGDCKHCVNGCPACDARRQPNVLS